MTMLTNQTMVLGRDAGGRDCWSATYTERGCFHSTFDQISSLTKSAMKPLTLIFEGSRQLDLWFWRQLPSGRPTSNCQPCLSTRQPVVERGNGNKKTIKDTTVFQHIFDIWAKTTRKKECKYYHTITTHQWNSVKFKNETMITWDYNLTMKILSWTIFLKVVWGGEGAKVVT